jgi:hypothetical protein
MERGINRSAKRVVLVGAAMALSLLSPVVLTGAGVSAGHPPIIHLRQGTSANWSGYAAFGNAGSFHQRHR